MTSCSKNECDSDSLFEEKFNNCIKVVQRFNTGGAVRSKYRYESIECLEAVTGHESVINKDGDTPYFYNNEDDFLNKDFAFWDDWFEKNKCRMTLKQADSLIELHSKEIGELNWPPDIKLVDKDTLSY